MRKDTLSVEAVRACYRPERITTLFVGESAPRSGAFFYYGDPPLTGYMKKAIDAAGLGGKGDFLDRFKAYGWYLDDLVLTPVNDLKKPQRRQLCQDAKNSLAIRIAEYRPLAIVSLLICIKDFVEAAAIAAGSTAPRFAVHFPLQGNLPRFQKDMAHILPQLPRELE